MNYSPTLQFAEALDAHNARAILPTTLRTAMLQQLPEEIRRQAFFSAGVSVADWLEDWHELITDLLEGNTDRASARLAIKQQLARSGYVAEPGTEGGLMDLSSDRRLELILDTQWEQQFARGQWEQAQQPGISEAFPARELYRAMSRAEPRDWHSKWVLAGGKFYEHRSIARVDDPIWRKPLEAGAFNRFGNPMGPFDFNSGMRTKPVSYEEAVRMGVIAEGDALPRPEVVEPIGNAVTRRRMSQPMKDAVETAGLGQWDADGVLHEAPPY